MGGGGSPQGPLKPGARPVGCGWSSEDAGLQASWHKRSASRAPPATTTRSSLLFSSPPHLPQTEDSCDPQGAQPQDPPLCRCPLHACLCTPNAGCWRVGNLSTTEAPSQGSLRRLLHHTACPVSTTQARAPGRQCGDSEGVGHPLQPGFSGRPGSFTAPPPSSLGRRQ